MCGSETQHARLRFGGSVRLRDLTEKCADLLRSGALPGRSAVSIPARCRPQLAGRPVRRLKRAIMPTTSTTLRIPLAAALRRPGHARPVVAAAQLDGLTGWRPRSRPDRRSPSTSPRAGLRGHRRAGHRRRPVERGVQPLPRARSAARSPCTSASCTSGSRSRARPTCSTDDVDRPRAAGPRRAPARAAARAALPPPTARACARPAASTAT